MKATNNITCFILLLCSLSNSLVAQDKSKFVCGYNTSIKPELCDFFTENKNVSNKSAKTVIKSIVDLVGLPQNFILIQCSNLNNAYALLSSQGERYIIIDSQWLSAIGSKNWLMLGVLAHEIGHHLCGHTSVNKTLTYTESQKQELEADKFAGFILQGLGATLDQALTAINTLVPLEIDDTYSTHPKRSRRLIAINAGYSKTETIVTPTNLNTSAEEYFNLALEAADDPPTVNTSSDALLKSLYFYQEALKINPNFLHALLNAGVLYYTLGQQKSISASQSWGGAMNYYSKVLELDPTNSNALNNIGLMYFTAGSNYKDYNSYLTALKYFNRVIELYPNHATAYFNRALTYSNFGYAFHQPTQPLACSDWLTACRLGKTKGCDFYLKLCKY